MVVSPVLAVAQVLDILPEAASGGPIGLIQEGDIIELNIRNTP